MSNFEIVPSTIGNGDTLVGAAHMNRSLKKYIRLGNKRYRVFLIICGATIAETVTVKNGRRAQIWRGSGSQVGAALIQVTAATSGPNTVYTVSEVTLSWTNKYVFLAVEVPI